ncbi:MAG: hypothetical protein ACI4VC_00120 [Clostridia bacterium]
MAFFVNEEKNIKNNKAVKEFTDRVEPRNVFWEKYNLIKGAILNEEKIPIQIITFYGIGGAGKTRLLERIRYELERESKDTKYCYIDFEKLKYLNNDVLSILNAIKAELNKKYKFEFPLFDLAAYEYKTKLGIEASKPELENVLVKNRELSFLVSFIEEIPLVGTFAKVASMVDEGASILRNRFKDVKLKERFKELDNTNEEELRKLLPYYFAVDFQDNIKNEKLPFVFQLDTYERLVNELTQVGSISKADEWLKGEDGLIRNINNVLWVIAGREKLKWEDEDKNWTGNLDQHLLGDLSEEDSTSFLRSAGITEEDLINQIYKMTCGTPVFLDMCVDTYYKFIEQNQKPTAKDFSGDRRKLIERFFTYMNDSEKDFVTVLAFIGNWTDNNIEDRIRPVLGNFSFSLYEKIKQFSFVIHEGENYKIHETIRDVITEEASPIIKNKFNTIIREKQEEKITQIEKIETIEEIKEIDKSSNKENMKNIEEQSLETKKVKKSAMYLQNIKAGKYCEVIDEIVSNIIEFLYQKPKFTKATKKEYCDMVNNLLDKIEKYLEIYDGRYDPKKIETILNYKIFKNTYEYKRLQGLYICLCRYYNVRKDSNIATLRKNKFTYKDVVEHYKIEKRMYKNSEDQMKQISYIIKILADGQHTLASQEYIKRSSYFTSYELDQYIDILKKNQYKKSSVENMLANYTRRHYKEFKQGFDEFYEENKNTENIYYKRLLVRLSLAIVFEEFKGKPGTGYLMRDYRLRKGPEREYKYAGVQLVDKNEINEEIEKKIKEEKIKFINHYINIAMELVTKNRELIDSTAMELFTKVAIALYDEQISDEIKMKIFDFFIKIEEEILESNNSAIIEKYCDLIYKFSQFAETFSIEYRKKESKKFEELENVSLKLLDDLYNKMQEIYGKYDSRAEKIKCEYKVRLLLLYYQKPGQALDIYKEARYTDRSNIQNLKLEKIKEQFAELFKCFKPYYNINIHSEEILIQTFNTLYPDYEELINYYFENYKTIGTYKAQDYDRYWQRFMILPIYIYYRTGNISYYKKMIDLFYDKVKNLKMIPTLNIFNNFSYLLDLLVSCSYESKYNELVWYSLELLSKIFNNDGIKEFPKSNVYDFFRFRYDLGLYTSLLLSKISYCHYLSDKDKKICSNFRFSIDKNNNIVETSGTKVEESSNLQFYINNTRYARFEIIESNKLYQLIQEKEKIELKKNNSKTILEDIEITKFFMKKGKDKGAKEYATLNNFLYNSMLNSFETYESKEDLKEIIRKHTKGIFKEKDGGADFVEFGKAINTINSYGGKMRSLNEIKKLVEQL